jgi:Heparan-alpha-glucosaminide N-acetyltransferase, catalytic
MQRDLPLDAMRTLAVLGMMATHTTRLIPLRERWEVQHWAMRLEPIIPALFLALVGASLVLSHARSEARPDFSAKLYVRKQVLRALMLWAVSVVFYLADDGWHWPDALAAPGILATIGGAILVLTAVMSLPGRMRPFVLAVTLLGGIALYVYCDIRSIKLVWLTSGNSPVLPLWLFAFAGGLFAWASQRAQSLAAAWGKTRLLTWVLGPSVLATGAFLFAWLANRYGLEALFSKPLGRADAARVFTVWRDGAEKSVTLGYYNLRPVLSAAVAGLLLAMHQALRLGLQMLSNPGAASRTITWFLALGRHSLGVYILHLALLAILVVTGGKRPLPSAEWGLAVYAGLIAVCLAYAHGREAWAKR